MGSTSWVCSIVKAQRISTLPGWAVSQGHSDPQLGRVAGIDFGTVRVGIAVTDRRRTLASPLETYTRRTPVLDAARFRHLVADEEIVQFVVGLPVHLDGRESQKSAEARCFGQWLAEITGVPVDFFDERFTTAHAEEILISADLTSKRRQQRRDMLAAQILLVSWLESQSKGQTP